ncbi:MAG: Calx-beta domain-containing protein [Gammaproteobacteria bacterium]
MKSSIIIFFLALFGTAYANAEIAKANSTQQVSQGTRALSSPHTDADSACLNPREEAQLKLIENKTFGQAHAADHAHSRAERCAAIRQVPAASVNKSAKPSLLTRWLDRINVFVARFTTPAYAATGLPSQVGQWDAPFDTPIVGIHTTLMPNGKVLFWTYGIPRNNVNNVGVAYVWNPTDGTGHRINLPYNFWCSGQALLADGRVLLVGGNLDYGSNTTYAKGLHQIYTFNPYNETLTRQPDMRHGRWYPTVTVLADGRAVITSGLTELGDLGVNPDIEVFTPSGNIDGVGTVQVVSGRNIAGLYPHQYLLPNGRMLLAGPGVGDTAILNPIDWSWSDIPNLLQPRYGYGSGVLLPGGPNGSNKVMLIGGASNQFGVVATTEVFDNANPGAGWQFRASMPQGRRNHNTVILPDGTLLTVGGNSSTENYTNPTHEALLYIPASNTWKPMASQIQQRAYHSTAILLPDARVLSAGDDGPTTPGGVKNEIFSPPYLFNGPRPTISSAPAQITWSRTFNIVTPDSVTQAVLIAPGATTHGNDMHQRYVPLVISSAPDGITVTAPPNANVAPPGYYMLFVLNSQGVPSVSTWVQLGADATPAPATLQFNSASYSVTEGTATATVAVTRSGGSTGSASVNYASSDGTATAGSDYTASSGTLTFAAGEISKTFTVPITDDTLVESSESVNLSLTAPTGATLGSPDTAVLTIADNDSGPTSTVSLNSSSFFGYEETSAVITVYRANGSVGAFTVDYATSDGTALAGNDYTTTTGTLSWANGEFGSKTFSVPILNDGVAEPKENFNLSLSNPTNGVTITPNATAVFSIAANTGTTASTLQFSNANYSVTEGTATATVAVTRSGSSTGSASVNYASSDGTATAGSDYTASSGTLSFAAGELSKTFTVPITDDTLVESSESVNLSLTAPTGATLGSPDTAVLTIADNDSGGSTTTATVNFNSSAFGGTEGTAVVITVYRATSSAGAFSVDYSTSNGTAIAGSDYTATSGTLRWANGEVGSKTFTVPLLQDGVSEPKESINMALSNPTNGATLGSTSTAILYIYGN